MKRFVSAMLAACALALIANPSHAQGPETVQRLLGTTSILYVGNSDIDLETAGRAGVPFIVFTEGDAVRRPWTPSSVRHAPISRSCRLLCSS